MTEPVRPPWMRAVQVLLYAAIVKDFAAANRIAEKIAARWPDDTGSVILALVDTTIDAVRPEGWADGDPVHLAFSHDGGQTVTGADVVPAEVAWAGRLVAARAAMDEDTFIALMNAPAEDEWPRHFGRLVSSLGLMLAQHPQWLAAAQKWKERRG
jgi:hypothetical protein